MDSLKELMAAAATAPEDRIAQAVAILKGDGPSILASEMSHWVTGDELRERLAHHHGAGRPRAKLSRSTLQRWGFPVVSVIGGVNRYDMREVERIILERSKEMAAKRTKRAERIHGKKRKVAA